MIARIDPFTRWLEGPMAAFEPRNAALLALLAGPACATTGTIEGQLSERGEPAQAITLVWDSRLGSLHGSMRVTLADGERFTGEFVQLARSTPVQVYEPLYDGWYDYDDWGAFGDPWYDGSTTTVWVYNYTNKVVARLRSDRGDHMRCRFRLDETERGMGGGGTGECQLSSGRRVRAIFERQRRGERAG